MVSKKLLLSLSLIPALATVYAFAGFDDDIKPIYYHSAIPETHRGSIGKIAFAFTIEEIHKDRLTNVANAIKQHCKDSLISINEYPEKRTIEFVIRTHLGYEGILINNLIERCLERVLTINLKPLYYQTSTETIILKINNTIING